MPDYIEREALTNSLDELCDRVCLYSKKNRAVMCGACPLGHAFDLVEDIPAANVREVVRGEWKQIEEVNDGGPLSAWLLSRYHTYACSICGYKFLNLHEDDRMYNFCPNCGAKMVKGEASHV